jgi:hypothetical protein
MAYKTHQELYILFESQDMDLLKVEKYSPSKEALPLAKHKEIEETYNASPLKKRLRLSTINNTKTYKETLTEEILEHLSPISKLLMSRLFDKDDKLLEKMDEEEEILDKIYTYFENKEVGTYMELWVCSNIICPGCKTGILLKYKSLSQPVVDVMCSNPEHNILIHGPKYYQIKATQKGKTMNGKRYFSMNESYIKVGSRRFGNNAHEIKISDDINIKKVLIGYICIEYTRESEDSRIINIDKKNSFILIPNINHNLIVGEEDKYYYKYIEHSDKFPTVIFNPELFTIIDFSILSILRINSKVNLDDKYDFFESVQKSDLFKKKYLKYKMKYLQLKSLSMISMISMTSIV